MTLLEVVGREDRSVAAGAHRLRLLHRLLTLVSAARAREREAEVVRRGHVVRFFVERGTKGRNRIGLAPLLQIDLSRVDEGADVARIELAGANASRAASRRPCARATSPRMYGGRGSRGSSRAASSISRRAPSRSSA